MHLIDGPGATNDNLFTEGNPTSGVAPTQVTAAWANMVQGELLAVLVAAGIEPDKLDNAQLAAAIATLIAAQAVTVEQATTTAQGIVELATNAEAVAGTDTERAVTPAALAAALAAISLPAGIAYTNVVQAYTRQQYAGLVLREGVSGAQAVDLDLHQALMITATGALTMSDPTNMAHGKTCLLYLYASSAQAVSWSTAWHGTSLASLPTALTAGKLLMVSAVCVTTPAGTYMVPIGVAQEA